MTVFLNSVKARRRLSQYATVKTIRDHQIVDGHHELATGNYKMKKTFALGNSKFLTIITTKEQLEEHVSESGFATTDEWLAEAVKMHCTLPAYLHEVTLTKTR